MRQPFEPPQDWPQGPIRWRARTWNRREGGFQVHTLLRGPPRSLVAGRQHARCQLTVTQPRWFPRPNVFPHRWSHRARRHYQRGGWLSLVPLLWKPGAETTQKVVSRLLGYLLRLVLRTICEQHCSKGLDEEQLVAV